MIEYFDISFRDFLFLVNANFYKVIIYRNILHQSKILAIYLYMLNIYF